MPKNGKEKCSSIILFICYRMSIRNMLLLKETLNLFEKLILFVCDKDERYYKIKHVTTKEWF